MIIGFLPIEKEKWRNSEYITDNNFQLDYNERNYSETGKVDFSPEKPSLTYDLGETQFISLIGIVFYKDKIKQANPSNPKRKYTFSLEISIDGNNWMLLKEENNQESSSSIRYWLEHGFKARYIRFSKFENNLNNSIHVVEIEVLSGIISNFDYEKDVELNELPITPSFLGSYLAEAIIDIEEPIKKLSSSLEKKLSETEETYDEILDERKNINESINQLKILGSLKEFNDEAVRNNQNSRFWLISFFVVVTIFICILLYFLFYDGFLDEVFKIKIIQKRNIKIISHYAARGLFLSFLIFIINMLYKNFKNEKHNYTVNTHKAMSLRVILDLRAKDVDQVIKDQLLLKSMELILSHQESGYTKGGENNNPIINSIIENIPKSQIS